MARKLTKAEQIARIPDVTISKLKGDAGRQQLIKYVRTLRSSYNRRVASFKRNNLVSYAQIALENSDVYKSKVPLTKMTRNQLILEFSRYANFFNSETSTKQGINKVNREQDIRIFGADSRGRPKRTMTSQERIDYWNLYDEFKNQEPSALGLYQSGNIQAFLGEAIYGNDSIPVDNLPDFFRQLRERLKENRLKESQSVPNVFSGRGFTYPD